MPGGGGVGDVELGCERVGFGGAVGGERVDDLVERGAALDVVVGVVVGEIGVAGVADGGGEDVVGEDGAGFGGAGELVEGDLEVGEGGGVGADGLGFGPGEVDDDGAGAEFGGDGDERCLLCAGPGPAVDEFEVAIGDVEQDEGGVVGVWVDGD